MFLLENRPWRLGARRNGCIYSANESVRISLVEVYEGKSVISVGKRLKRAFQHSDVLYG